VAILRPGQRRADNVLQGGGLLRILRQVPGVPTAVLGPLQQRSGPQFPSWQGWRPRADFAKLLPTRDAVAALAQAAPDPVKLDALQQWEESRSGPLVIDVAEYASKMLYFYRGNDYAADLLDLIEARRIALGDVPPAILPVYSRATLGNFPYIQPHKDWYDTPLGPTDKLADRGLKLRLRRRPHFIEMAAGGKAVFTLNVTNWSGAPLAGTVTVDRAPGLKVTPASRKFNLPPDKAADLQFSISDAGAEPGYVDIEFVLTYGDMTERVPIRARIYAAGQGLDSKQYQGSELLGLTPRRQEFKLLAGDTLTTRLTIRNLTFENITVNLSFESPPPGVKAELRPATLYPAAAPSRDQASHCLPQDHRCCRGEPRGQPRGRLRWPQPASRVGA